MCMCLRESRTELADVVVAGGLRHGSDGQQGAVVSSQRLAELLLSVVGVRSAQSVQLLEMHLTHTHQITTDQIKESTYSEQKPTRGQEVEPYDTFRVE